MLEFTVKIKAEDLEKIQNFFEKWVDDFEFGCAYPALIKELFYLYDERGGDCLDLREDVMVSFSFTKDAPTYKIVRNYFRNRTKRTIVGGFTLSEAQAHCNNPETSSSTCEKAENQRRTRRVGPWFDSYVKE